MKKKRIENLSFESADRNAQYRSAASIISILWATHRGQSQCQQTLVWYKLCTYRFKCTWSLHYYCAFGTCSDAHTQCLDVSLCPPHKRDFRLSVLFSHLLQPLRMNLLAIDFPCANNTPIRSYICIFFVHANFHRTTFTNPVVST